MEFANSIGTFIFLLGCLIFVISADEQMEVYQLIGRDVILRHHRMSILGKPRSWKDYSELILILVCLINQYLHVYRRNGKRICCFSAYYCCLPGSGDPC